MPQSWHMTTPLPMVSAAYTSMETHVTIADSFLQLLGLRGDRVCYPIASRISWTGACWPNGAMVVSCFMAKHAGSEKLAVAA